MSDNYTIEFFGWNQEPTKTGAYSDKCWGLARMTGSDNVYQFWGRRGKNFSWKLNTDGLSKQKSLISSKVRKGYRDFTENPASAWDDFDSMFPKQLVTARMTGKIRGEGFDD